MQEDTLKDIINDVRVLANCHEIAQDLIRPCVRTIADRLERLADKGEGARATSKAHVLEIGCQPAIYKKADGHFTALAHGNQTTYVMDIKLERGRVVGRFQVDGREALTMEGDSFYRVIRCLASASNAYVAMNQHAKERKRRRRAEKKEGK